MHTHSPRSWWTGPGVPHLPLITFQRILILVKPQALRITRAIHPPSSFPSPSSSWAIWRRPALGGAGKGAASAWVLPTCCYSLCGVLTEAFYKGNKGVSIPLANQEAVFQKPKATNPSSQYHLTWVLIFEPKQAWPALGIKSLWPWNDLQTAITIERKTETTKPNQNTSLLFF